MRKVTTCSVSATVGFLGFLGLGGGSDNPPNDQGYSFGAKEVQADSPHGVGGGGGTGHASFHVECLTEGGALYLGKVSPRYCKTHVDALKVPQDGIREDGSISLRITATKRHYLTHLACAQTKPVDPDKVSISLPKRVFDSDSGADYTQTLATKNDGNYVATLPSDRLDVEFVVDKVETTTNFIDVSGFYAPLSDQGARDAGDWVGKLDSEAVEMLEDMFGGKENFKDARRMFSKQSFNT